MTTRIVGPTGDYASIAAAIAAAIDGDTIELQSGYTEGGIVSVTKDNLSFSGDATNTGIYLALANGINNITLLGDAPFRVDDNGSGDSTITGNAGDDTFEVTGGNDHVDGGLGSDTLIVDYSTSITTDVAIFGALDVGTQDGYRGVYYNPNVGTPYVNFNNIDVFNITTGVGNDTIETGAGNDTIKTGAGNDQIISGDGADQIDGGTGTDRWAADFSAQSTAININLNGTSAFLGTGTATGIEELGTQFVTFKTGSGNDTIVTRTNLDLADKINTGDGADSITVGGVAATGPFDDVDGGSGNDTLVVDYSTTTMNMNSIQDSGSLASGYNGSVYNGSGTHVVNFHNIENFSISTGSGNDNITTWDGDDVLNLGTGNDVAHAAGGTDRLIVDYSASTASVTTSALTGTVAGGYSGSVTDGTNTTTFDGIENFTITGGSGNDSITTGDGDDVLRGGPGQDALHGAGGSDTLVVGTGDVASGDVFDGGAGSDTLQVISTADLTGATLTSIENLAFVTGATSTVTFSADRLGGSNLAAALAVTGDANANQIVVSLPSSGTVDLSGWTFTNWTTGSDTITVNGSAGADTIRGSSRNDTLNGGGGNDDITGGVGNDDIDGGSGIDVVYYTGDKAEYTALVNGANVQITDSQSGRDGVDTFHNVEFVQFHDVRVAVNTAPAFADLSTAASTERVSAVLDSDVTVADTELGALNSGNGDYSGAIVTIARQLGASADDIFDFASSANFTVVGNELRVGGSAFATFSSSNGTLTISFANGGVVPTTALVNDVLQHITYANQSHNPDASVTLDWTVDDGQTTAFGGAFSATASQTVTIAAINDAPVNTVPGAQTATEDTALTITGLSVSDADSGNATITTTLSVTHGTLNVAAGVSGGLTSGQIAGEDTATVTLTGTEAQIRATLTAASSVHYTGATDYNGPDALTVTTNDQNHTGSGGPQTDIDPVAITISEVNDAPIANDDSLSTIGEDAGTQTIAFTDLTSNDLKGPLTATDEGSQTLTVTNVSNPVGGTVTMTGGHVEFTPDANFNGTASFDYTITDNGTTNGFSAPQTATGHASFTVTAANDAPVVVNGTTATLLAIDEDATSPTGATVSSLFGGHFSDAADQVANGSSANAFAGVAVTGNAATASEGTWQYFAGNTWHAIGSVSDSSALLLDASTLIRFLPAANWNGTTPLLTVHLVDDFGGSITTGAPEDLSAVGGTTPYSLDSLSLSETVNALNDPVTAGAPPTVTVAEDDSVAISGLVIADVDATLAPNGVYQVTLSASNGTLNLGTHTGLAFTAGDGSADATMTFSGTLAAINTALGTASYAGNANYNGPDTIAFSVTDDVGGTVATGSGDPSTSSKNIAVTVTPANDPVTAGAPATASLAEDDSVAVSLSIADLDATLAPNGVYKVTLSASNGTLTLGTHTGLDFTAGDGTADAALAFSGTLADINTALATASYAGNANYNGTDTIAFTVTDDVNGVIATGSGIATSDSKSIAVTVSAVNDPVTASAPPTATVAEDDSVAIGGLSIADVDATLAPNGVYQVALSASNGTLTLGTHTGLAFTAGDGSADTAMTFSGTLAAINTALGTASYAGNANYNGPDTIAFSVTDDVGNTVATGSGDASSSAKTIAVTVTAVNDDVSASAPATASLAEDNSVAISGLSIADLDATLAPSGVYEVMLSASHGVLTLGTHTGLDFTAGDGTADATLTFHGTLAAINTALATASYAGDANYNGVDTIAFSVTDSFNNIVATGSGAATNDSTSIDVTVTEVNDAPTAGDDTLSSVAEDPGQRTILGSTLTGNDSAGPTNESGQTLTVTAITNVIGGSAILSGGDVLFTPTANFNGTASFDYTITDDGTTNGSADAKTATAHASFSVTAENDAVTASAPASASLAEDASVAISGLSIADLDATLAPNGVYEVALSASHGALTLSTRTGLTFTAADGTADAAMTFHGTLAAINTALATASYAGNANYNGADTIAFSVTDSFNSVVATGSGAATSDAKNINVTITAVNDAPSATNDTLSSVAEDSGQRTILGSTLTGNDSAGPSNESGQTLTVTAVSNVVGGSAIVSGGNVLFTPSANFNGTASFNYTVTDNGTTNSVSDPKTALGLASFAVTAANDPVTASVPSSLSLSEDTVVAIGGLSIADVDATLAPGTAYEVSLSASHGAITLGTVSGLAFTGGDGTSDAAMTFHGTLAAINAALAGATYAGDADYNGSDSITLSVTDSFNGVTASGSGPVTSDSKTVGVTIAAVNDAPVETVPGTLSATSDGDLAIPGMSVADVDAGSGTLTTTLSAVHGVLSVGAVGADVWGSGTGTITITGTLSAINATLANNVTYHPLSGFSGADTLTLATNDHDNTGSGGELTDAQSFTVNIGEIAAPYQWAGSPDLGARGVTWQIAGVGDFNHDGTSDVLWRDSATGQVDEWHIVNGQWAGSTELGARGLDWQVVGIGDFDNDGTGNVLWRNTTTGQLDEWRMSDGNWSGSVALGGRGTDWQVAGTGDFNGDGTSDILWRNTTTGHVDEWHMANGNWAASTDLGARGNEWQIAGTGDFNHDGTSDVLWHNPTTGQTDLWLMANGNWSSSVELGSFNTAWQIAAVNDFNGDGTADVLWRNPTTGEVDGWVMEHGNWKASVSFGPLDPAYHVAGSGDFNHDHNADILWHDSANGHVAEWLLAPA